ncbi:hypothetical protein [[Phormidium] sp. ETS-05]|uniref:hypothetical protein n=1 Tax=[Phormidium] sp. ETS-05 TaxID=222819 RepID=UPI0018EF09BD|nr:hypothetical protein [[Phormidium] sp. ETS-05]
MKYLRGFSLLGFWGRWGERVLVDTGLPCRCNPPLPGGEVNIRVSLTHPHQRSGET